MRQRTRIVPLLLLILVGVLAVPLVSFASAEADGWAGHIAEMDRALAQGDTQRAGAAWREAYVAAHVSRDWPGMLAVGDAALRAGHATGTLEVFRPRARRAYLTALLRARRHGSPDGAFAAAEAFGRLGDHDAARQARVVATDLVLRAEATARRGLRAF
jgi:hypothetical protein